ncbi:MAG TPA: class I SAM-dependent methyltransferase [Mycobacteriales bacterium]|jgi:SAM-dependent methyltransferase|nr:class I SAM-dependent methyltransferase [Mycobacteriales bacterium]
MNDAMEAEFDTVAEWTAEVALSLGADHYLPAACRGSGSPATLDWLIDRLDLRHADRLLDCGAGAGGPAGYAADRVGVRPVLSEPEAGACRAARRLFGFPTVQAGTELPFASASFDVAWCLGVLCTVERQDRLLGELRRVLTPAGRLGLLVFVAATGSPPARPDGNNFPTRGGLLALLAGADLAVRADVPAAVLGDIPPAWQERADAVDAELDRRHHCSETWRRAVHQSELIGRLLASGELVAQAMVLSAG